MLTKKEKEFLEKKIKKIESTNQKITILLTEKLSIDLENKSVIKKDFKQKITKCEKDIFYLYNLANDMWFLAGDKSTDYNFYTKRLILSGILSKLYFKIFTLKNYNLEDLKKDIKNEIKNVGKFNKLKSQFISFIKNMKGLGNQKNNTGRGY